MLDASVEGEYPAFSSQRSCGVTGPVPDQVPGGPQHHRVRIEVRERVD
jgi:hypothetical protein